MVSVETALLEPDVAIVVPDETTVVELEVGTEVDELRGAVVLGASVVVVVFGASVVVVVVVAEGITQLPVGAAPGRSRLTAM